MIFSLPLGGGPGRGKYTRGRARRCTGMGSRPRLQYLRAPETARNARELRAQMTDAERLHWHYLRAHRFHGLGFRRQVPLGSYIVDFLCESQRLIVEVDGGQHADRAVEDARRTQWLEAQGYRVVRFWNNEVLGNMEGVWEALTASLR